MTGQVSGYYPFAVMAMEPFWQHFKFTPDWFVGIGNTSGVGTPDKTFNEYGDLDAFFFAYLKVPDNIYCCPGRNE